MSIKPESFRQLCWAKIRNHRAVAIVARYDELRTADAPVEQWAAALQARADESLAAATRLGTVAAAQAALDARNAAREANVVAKAVREGVSSRAYQFIESPEHRKEFGELAASIAASIASLPPPKSREDALARSGDGLRFSAYSKAITSQCGAVGGDSCVVGMVRYLGALATLPPLPVPVLGENMPFTMGSRARPPVEPRRSKWATLFKGEPLSPTLAQ